MKKGLFFLFMILAIAFVMVGCTGSAAREKTLFPAITEMWENLRPDAMSSTLEPDEVAPMDNAVGAGSKIEIVAAWTFIEPYVRSGIQVQINDGTMSELKARSKLETVNRMTKAISVYASD